MACKPTVVITGTSSGIGLQLALQMAKKSYNVIATMRAPKKAPSALTALGCDVQPLDVTDQTTVDALAAYAQSTYSGCDILINNAGFGLVGSIEVVEVEDAKRVYDVNVWGVMRMCKAFAPQMRAKGGGVITTISSTSGIRGLPCFDIYTSSKMAVEGMMESFRYSVESDNIKILLIQPGPVVTDFLTRLRDEHEAANKIAKPGRCARAVNLTSAWLQNVCERIEGGQTAESCALETIKVVEGAFSKMIVNGKETVSFWNPTSEYARTVIENILRIPDGNGGEYAAIFKTTRDILNPNVEKKESG